MNWRLLVYLSLFGFVMAIATISFVPTNIEMMIWPFIFGLSAYSIGKHCDRQFFLNGFILGVIDCIYLVAFRIAFFQTYNSVHTDLLTRLSADVNQRMATIAATVIFGIISGLIIGLLSLAVAKIQKKF